MDQWYRRPVVKTILILAAALSAAVTVVLLALVGGLSGSMSLPDIFRVSRQSYEETDSFKTMIYEITYSVLEQLEYKEQFETEGNYNPDKLVDIMEYYENNEITGENESGVAYRLGDLVDWGTEYINGEEDYYSSKTDVIVCQKPDGTYYYYYVDAFQQLIRSGQISIYDDDGQILSDDSVWMEEYLTEMEEISSFNSLYSYDLTYVGNTDESIIYMSCWALENNLDEKYAPEDAENLLELVNENADLNGRLSEIVSALQSVLSNIGYSYELYESNSDNLAEGNTNLTYLYVDESAKKIYTNNSAYSDYANLEDSLEAIVSAEDTKYVIINPKLGDFQSNMDVSAGEWRMLFKNFRNVGNDDILAISVDTTYPIMDIINTQYENYMEYVPYLRSAGVWILGSIFVFLLVLIWLTLTAGRKRGDEEVHLIWFDRWKTEIGAVAAFLPWILMTIAVASVWNGFGSLETYDNMIGYYYTFIIEADDIFIMSVYSAGTVLLFYFGYMSLVRRIKAHTVWANSVLSCICRLLKEFWENRSVTLRVLLLFAGFVFIHWLVILVGLGNVFFVLLMFAVEAAAAYFVIRHAIARDRIRKGIEEIEAGNVDYQISTEKMKGDDKVAAEKINNIGNGLNKAVDGALKSERLKTDLITNVSHDIKTPLTSIINYVDLLKRENIDDPKVQGYLEILEAKAQRLKTLTEDVVEASKVSSGNISLEYMDVNLTEMLHQIIGEMSEKLEARELKVVMSAPEEPEIVRVDGRRMWRVLENIFQNAAKYAMPGTRVYTDLKDIDGKVIFSLKNVSEQPLNINADELTERFIRGDISRSTEGSGLGLSIAKSLTTMQGGTFDLYLDGDLFKVTITFPKIMKIQQQPVSTV